MTNPDTERLSYLPDHGVSKRCRIWELRGHQLPSRMCSPGLAFVSLSPSFFPFFLLSFLSFILSFFSWRVYHPLVHRHTSSFFGCTCNIQKFWGQGSNSSHSMTQAPAVTTAGLKVLTSNITSHCWCWPWPDVVSVRCLPSKVPLFSPSHPALFGRMSLFMAHT